MPQSKIHWFDMEESPSLRMAGASPDLFAALSRLAVWSDLGPCFCGACDYMPGRPERHKHTAECEQARAAMAKAAPAGAQKEAA